MTGTTPEDPAHSLRLALIEAQYVLRAQTDNPDGHSVLVLVSGVELAGKGQALTQLREWMDPRLLKVSAQVPQNQDGQLPFWQPYADKLPARGEMVVLFGNWYSDLISAYLSQNPSHPMSDAMFNHHVDALRQFEQYLQAEGMVVVKCWFDLPWQMLQQRLDDLDPSLIKWQQLHGLDWRNQAHYQRVQDLHAQLGQDWITIDSQDEAARDLSFGQVVLQALTQARPPRLPALETWSSSPVPSALIAPDTHSMQKELYKSSRKKIQKQLIKHLRSRGERPLIVVFEGMDAAGKGGAIRRVVQALDPREYEIHSIAAPEDYERRHGYLWRFWQHLPEHGGMTIFDRSWYGRVLVERIEGFATPAEWQQAYEEINHFEQQLIDHGAIIIKFWLAIDQDEQFRRFEAREHTAHKRFKLTPDDWRNREHWDDYVQAAADMLAHTHTPDAPWVVVATNDKYTARLQVLEALSAHLARVLAG